MTACAGDQGRGGSGIEAKEIIIGVEREINIKYKYKYKYAQYWGWVLIYASLRQT